MSAKLEKIRAYHLKHPEYTYADLCEVFWCSMSTVSKALRGPVAKPVDGSAGDMTFTRDDLRRVLARGIPVDIQKKLEALVHE